jgi:hypothetical protein
MEEKVRLSGLIKDLEEERAGVQTTEEILNQFRKSKLAYESLSES